MHARHPIERLDPRTEPVRAILRQSDAYMASLYPSESNHMESEDALARPDLHFFGVWIGATVAACGAVKIQGDDGRYGEIKRVFVMPEFRGRGLSRQVMAQLEATLLELDIGLARLETGIHQPEALGLYAALGYSERPPFGSYAPDPLSVFMEKRLRFRSDA